MGENAVSHLKLQQLTANMMNFTGTWQGNDSEIKLTAWLKVKCLLMQQFIPKYLYGLIWGLSS